MRPCTELPGNATFRTEVFTGKTDYKRVAEFRPVYLKPARCILGLAGWPYNKHDFISPNIYLSKESSKLIKNN
jgi:hypothetical protein